MKKVLAGVLCAASGVALASPADSCERLEEVARGIMTARQNDVELSRMIEYAKNKSNPSPIESYESLVLEAYKKELRLSDSEKNIAATEFAIQQASKCYAKGSK